MVFDIVNRSKSVLYVVNDDSEHEMLDVSSAGQKLRLARPAVVVCGKTLAPLHPDRFVYAIAPGETRTVGSWDKKSFVDGGKVCIDCKAQGRPDLGIERYDGYELVDVAVGAYVATVKVLTALPPGCTPAAQGFSCKSWPGAAALATSIRTSQASAPVDDTPANGVDQHVTVTF
jgi:hypothetical protein